MGSTHGNRLWGGGTNCFAASFVTGGDAFTRRPFGSWNSLDIVSVEELLVHNRTTRATPRPFVSVEEAALLLGEARSIVYRSVKAGTFPLPVVRIGARIRIPRIAVDRREDPPLANRNPYPSKA